MVTKRIKDNISKIQKEIEEIRNDDQTSEFYDKELSNMRLTSLMTFDTTLNELLELSEIQDKKIEIYVNTLKDVNEMLEEIE